MARLLLRLLLIVSLVANGAAAPWAMAGTVPGTQAVTVADRENHGAQDDAAPHADHLHHGDRGSPDAAAPHHDDQSARDGGPATTSHAHHDHASMTHEGPMAGDSCCEGAGCDCGCVLPPMLARPAAASTAHAAALPPVAEPPLRARLANTAPPFRPPAV